MNNQKKILQFRLNGQLIEQLRQQKTVIIDCLKNKLDIVLNESRIHLNYKQDSKASTPTAVYYNNNGSNLHFLGEAVPATTSVSKIHKEEKPAVETQKALIDIPHSDITASPPLPSLKSANQTKAPLKKSTKAATSSTNVNQKKQKPVSNIPSTPLQPNHSRATATTPQKTPKPSKAELEEGFSVRTRIIQRLALQPRSVAEIVKSIDRTQQAKCDQLEIKDILEHVGILIKKGERNKYCLKPTLYKEINIWEWPYYSADEKRTVAENAKEAYDLMSYNGLDIDRSNLYHPDSPYKPPRSPAHKRSPLNNRKLTPQLQRTTTPTTSSATPKTPKTPLRNSPQTKLKQPSPTKPKSSPARPASPVQRPIKTPTKEVKKSSLDSVKPPVKKSPSELKKTNTDTKYSDARKPLPSSSSYEIKKSSPSEVQKSSLEIKKSPVEIKKSPATTNSPVTNIKKSSSSQTSQLKKDTLLLPPKRTPKSSPAISTKKPPAESPVKKPVNPPKPSSSSSVVKKPVLSNGNLPPPTKLSSKRKHEDEDEGYNLESQKKEKMLKSSQGAARPVVTSKKPMMPPKELSEPREPTEPVDIKTQREFDAYCFKFVKEQSDYSRIKRVFKASFPEYVKAIESTEPPKGTKRSYFDLNVEYRQMVHTKFLQDNKGKKDDLKDAEDLLLDCNNKRRRLNYMWTSIKQNKEEHKYKIPNNVP